MSGPELEEALSAIRPRLHRYAARMMGSAFDGEDVVQEAAARALQAGERVADVASIEAWLFRITHNCAIDALRRRRHEAWDGEAAEALAAADRADSRVAAAAGLAAFLPLVPAQRACVALVDVLGHSAAETGQILGLSVAAVKAALHRGREALRATAERDRAPALSAAERERLRHYADRFNAHDWDALRDLLAEDVELDLAARRSLAGKRDVSVYFARYAELPMWLVSPGLAEGRPALLMRDRAQPDAPPAFVVLLGWRGGAIASIRDFHYARYVMDGLDWADAPRSLR